MILFLPTGGGGIPSGSFWSNFIAIMTALLWFLLVFALMICGITFPDRYLHPEWITPSPWWYLLLVAAVLVFVSGLAFAFSEKRERP